MNEKDSENIHEIRNILDFVRNRWVDLYSGEVPASLLKKDSENLQKISGADIKTKLIEGAKREFSINVDKLKNDYPDIRYCNIFDGLKKTYENDL